MSLDQENGPTWLSEGVALVASPCRAFMASSAAICFATFLLGALTVGKVWFPIATQYWNLTGEESSRIKMVLIREIYLTFVRLSSLTTCHFLAHITSVPWLTLSLLP